MRPSRAVPLLVFTAFVLLACGACASVESTGAERYVPAVVEPVPGSTLPRIRFTDEASRRTGLQTHPVTASSGELVIPYAALIYDPTGGTWVYAEQERLTFQRTRLEVLRIDGDRVLASSGPPVGTLVVTTGAAEVYGSELGMDGGH